MLLIELLFVLKQPNSYWSNLLRLKFREINIYGAIEPHSEVLIVAIDRQ